MVIVAMVKIGSFYTILIWLFTSYFNITHVIIITIYECLLLADTSSLSEINSECPGFRNTTEEQPNVS